MTSQLVTVEQYIAIASQRHITCPVAFASRSCTDDIEHSKLPGPQWSHANTADDEPGDEQNNVDKRQRPFNKSYTEYLFISWKKKLI